MTRCVYSQPTALRHAAIVADPRLGWTMHPQVCVASVPISSIYDHSSRSACNDDLGYSVLATSPLSATSGVGAVALYALVRQRGDNGKRSCWRALVFARN